MDKVCRNSTLTSPSSSVPVDLSSWQEKMERDTVAASAKSGGLASEGEEDEEMVLVEHHSDVAMEMGIPSQELFKDGVLTLGCVGKQLSAALSISLPVFFYFCLFSPKKTLMWWRGGGREFAGHITTHFTSTALTKYLAILK